MQVLLWVEPLEVFKECAPIVSAESVTMALSLFALPADDAAAVAVEASTPADGDRNNTAAADASAAAAATPAGDATHAADGAADAGRVEGTAAGGAAPAASGAAAASAADTAPGGAGDVKAGGACVIDTGLAAGGSAAVTKGVAGAGMQGGGSPRQPTAGEGHVQEYASDMQRHGRQEPSAADDSTARAPAMRLPAEHVFVGNQSADTAAAVDHVHAAQQLHSAASGRVPAVLLTS